MTKIISHPIGVRKKADSQKRVRKAKRLGNPGITHRRMISQWGGSKPNSILKARCTVTIAFVFANSSTQNAFCRAVAISSVNRNMTFSQFNNAGRITNHSGEIDTQSKWDNCSIKEPLIHPTAML